MYRPRQRATGSAGARGLSGSCSHGTRWKINVCVLLTGSLLLLISVARLQMGLTAVGEGLVSHDAAADIHDQLSALNFTSSGKRAEVLSGRGVRGGRMLKIDRLLKKQTNGRVRGNDVVDTGGGSADDDDAVAVARKISKSRLEAAVKDGDGGVVKEELADRMGKEEEDSSGNELATSGGELEEWVHDVDTSHGIRNRANSQSSDEEEADAVVDSEGRTDTTGDGERNRLFSVNSRAKVSGTGRSAWEGRTSGSRKGGDSRSWDTSKLESESGAFSTDDEPVDEETRNRLERITNIEDVLMLNKGSGSSLMKNETWGKIQDSLAQKEEKGAVKESFDPLNPANNPLLQDPDSADSGGLTKNDKLLLKALRFMRTEPPPGPVTDQETRRVLVDPMEELDTPKRPRLMEGRRKQSLEVEENDMSKRQDGNSQRADGTDNLRSSSGTEDINSILVQPGGRMVADETQADTLETSSDRPLRKEIEAARARNQKYPTKQMMHKLDLESDVKWGEFPGLHPRLSFSWFIDEFLFDEACTIRVFMAWMSPGWSFTVRHQRVLESLLYFHPKACVVVFSETVELDFFSSFVEDGYRVAVMQPNLAVLLDDTTSDVFATIWAEWRNVELFYIHYTELLRLAALYKYGGIYLDWDMIVLRPLDGLKNTLGTELLANGHQRPNGAIMVFDSFSPFLNITLDEYTATYDETRKEWNGAALLTRVLNAPPDDKYIHLAEEDRPHLEPPISFFPLTKSRIVRYFKTPEDEYAQTEDLKLLDKILSRSFTVHLWNELTHRLVPEPGSLVAQLMDKNCLRCTDYL